MKILVVYITMIFYMWIGAVILDLGLRMAVRQIEYNTAKICTKIKFFPHLCQIFNETK